MKIDDERAVRVGRLVLELVALLEPREHDDRPAYYSAEVPPPHHKWRAVLEAARRGELPRVRRGRIALVSREAYEAWIAGAVVTSPERLRVVRASDVATLDALGVRLRGAR